MVKSAEMRIKNQSFAGNIEKRGKVKSSLKKQSQYPAGPILIGFLAFVIVGSGIFQIFKPHLF